MQRHIAQYKLILSNLNNPGFFVLKRKVSITSILIITLKIYQNLTSKIQSLQDISCLGW